MVFFRAAHYCAKSADRCRPRIVARKLPHIRTERHSGIDTDQSGKFIGIISRGLQHLPRALQKQPYLRISELRFARREAKETSIEQVRIVQKSLGPHVAGIMQLIRTDSGMFQLLIRDEEDARKSLAEIFRESLKIGRLGKSSSQADDCYSVKCVSVHGVCVLLSFCTAFFCFPARS